MVSKRYHISVLTCLGGPKFPENLAPGRKGSKNTSADATRRFRTSRDGYMQLRGSSVPCPALTPSADFISIAMEPKG